ADAPFPFCVFVFTMDDDRGYYSWLKEPVLGGKRSAALRPANHERWGVLDSKAIAEIVRSVESWYEAQQQPQAA
ncbi:MAG TPA: hypothetical protein VF771_13975, partial [Longimicrobiaceae bacterium]